MKRRDFLRHVGRGLAGAGLGAPLVSSGLRSQPPSERLVVGHIGVGGMGNAHKNWFSSFPDVAVAALCDVDRNRLGQTAEDLKKKRPQDEVTSWEVA